jgi:hypothetical protein
MYHGSFYFTTPVQTDNAADTPIKIAGVTTGNDCSGFSPVGDNRLRYDGATQRVFQFTAAFSAKSAGITEGIFFIYKNGALIPGAQVYRSIATANDHGAVAITCLARMNKGDYVELWCQTDDDADDITVESGTLVATVAG